MSATVHAHNELPNGTPAQGVVVVTVNTDRQVIRDPAGNVVFQGPATIGLVDGEATFTLPGSDDDTLEPSGFTFTATEQLKHVARGDYREVEFQTTDGQTHHLADFAGTDEVAEDPSYGANLNGLTARVATLEAGGGGGGGADVSIDADGTLTVDGVTVELGTDSEIATAISVAVAAAATPDSSTTVKGKVELATNTETTTGTDTVRAVTPAGVAAALAVFTPKFDARISAYNATPSSLRLARAAVARAASGGATFHIATVGDSTEVGTPGATAFDNMWHRVLLANLLSRGSATRGTGMLSPNVAKRSGGPMTTTGLAEGHGAGIVKSSAYLPGGSGNTVTVTATTDQFRVMYQKRGSSGGAITATVDGGAVASIDTSSTGGTGVFFKTYDVAEGSHTLVLTAPASGNGFILGVEARRGGPNGSAKVDAFGYGGRTSVALADSTSEGDGSSIPSITALAADLLIVSIGINDYLAAGDAAPNQTTLSAYKTNMQAAITAQRAAGGDVLLIGWPPQGGTPRTIPQADYITKLYELCDENNVAMLDLQARWGSYAISNPLGYYYDEVHPNDLGLADWGSAVYTMLNAVGLVL